MEELTLTTLDHLVLRAKQIKEISDDFTTMWQYGIVVCTLSGVYFADITSLQVQSRTLVPLSVIANRKITFLHLNNDVKTEEGSFTYSGVKFFALFTAEEVEAYRAES